MQHNDGNKNACAHARPLYLHCILQKLQSGQDENLIKQIFYTFDMCVRKTARVFADSGESYIILARRSGEKNTGTQRIHHLRFRFERYVTFAWHLFHLQIYYQRDGFLFFLFSLFAHIFFLFLPPQDSVYTDNRRGSIWADIELYRIIIYYYYRYFPK